MLFYGDTSHGNRRSSTSASYVSYNRYSDRDRRDDRTNRAVFGEIRPYGFGFVMRAALPALQKDVDMIKIKGKELLKPIFQGV